MLQILQKTLIIQKEVGNITLSTMLIKFSIYFLTTMQRKTYSY